MFCPVYKLFEYSHTASFNKKRLHNSRRHLYDSVTVNRKLVAIKIFFKVFIVHFPKSDEQRSYHWSDDKTRDTKG